MGQHTDDLTCRQLVKYIFSENETFLSMVPSICGCEAFWLDTTGHPRTTVATAQISEGTLDLEMALNKISQLETTNQQCAEFKRNATNLLEQNRQELEHLKHFQQNASANLQVTSQELQNLKTFFIVNLDHMGFKSETFGGHKYYLSEEVYVDSEIANSVCRFYNGYLIEMEDQPEYDFALSFSRQGFRNDKVLVGAVDNGHEDNWTYVTSGKPVSYLHWAKDQPNGGAGDNCMYIQYSEGMIDGCCS